MMPVSLLSFAVLLRIEFSEPLTKIPIVL